MRAIVKEALQRGGAARASDNSSVEADGQHTWSFRSFLQEEDATRMALVMVKPATLICWHRQGCRLLWRWQSKLKRPSLPKDLQGLIRRMALENSTWGQERIANELLLKLGLRVSPRTVRKYMPGHCVGGPGKRGHSQRWSTFLRNHAKGIVACDFCVAVTATFRVLYVFVLIEHARRRLLHVNVTAHPTAQWTIQQFHDAIPADHTYGILLHDRDAIFSTDVDQGVRHMGLHVIKTPVQTPAEAPRAHQRLLDAQQMLAQFQVVVFDGVCATVMERLRQQQRRRKRYADLMIAAMVIAGQHILITRNRADFVDVLPSAQLANWIDDPPNAS